MALHDTSVINECRSALNIAERDLAKANGPKALPSEISHFLNKSKIASKYGQKDVRFMEAKMSICYVKDRPIMAIGSIWIMKMQSIGI